jgi:hypothetical protein
MSHSQVFTALRGGGGEKEKDALRMPSSAYELFELFKREVIDKATNVRIDYSTALNIKLC